MKKIAISISILTILFYSFILSYPTMHVDAKIIYVNQNNNENFSSIQQAIDNASTEDVIIVFPGNYDQITINKSLTIKAQHANIKSVYISVNNVTIDGFFVHDGSNGIVVTGDYNTIVNCSVFGYSYGLSIEGLYNTITNNSIFNNGFDGIKLEFSMFTEIINNDLFNNGNGLKLDTSDLNLIMRNVIHNNTRGIHIENSEMNTVKQNHIASNKDRGIHYCCTSSNNSIFENNFLKNKYNALGYGGPNKWTVANIGNFWDDYNKSVGFYMIDTENIDYSPLITPFSDIPFEPSFVVLYPFESSIVSNSFVVNGINEKGDDVYVRIDNDTWIETFGTFFWQLELDSTSYNNGQHMLYLKNSTKTMAIPVIIQNETNTGIPSFEIIILFLGFIMAIALYRK